IEALLEATDPQLVGLCFDTGHFMFGGGKDPLPILRTYWDRVWHIHFKDFAPAVAKSGAEESWDYFESVKQGVFCDLGKGAVNFKAVKALLEEKDYKGWIVVEQDVLPGMGNPKACASKNRQYLQSIGL
ncbi:MAG: sugar phosphate isomerase/epimerase, partial [Chitinophagaceae bacterium]